MIITEGEVFAEIQFLIGRLGVVDRKAVGDQPLDVQTPARHQLDERLKIAALGPPDVADRIVEPSLLVLAVVATRTIGSGQAHVEFLLVVGGSWNLESDVAHDDDRCPVAG